MAFSIFLVFFFKWRACMHEWMRADEPGGVAGSAQHKIGNNIRGEARAAAALIFLHLGSASFAFYLFIMS